MWQMSLIVTHLAVLYPGPAPDGSLAVRRGVVTHLATTPESSLRPFRRTVEGWLA